mmetsp:Transcript_151228/g.466438  ORF Transcript_151228/g.466438 Transcript_151228/m.466438 type:complete len:224 (+) Transcript_151228:336-1007(+)
MRSSRCRAWSARWASSAAPPRRCWPTPRGSPTPRPRPWRWRCPRCTARTRRALAGRPRAASPWTPPGAWRSASVSSRWPWRPRARRACSCAASTPRSAAPRATARAPTPRSPASWSSSSSSRRARTRTWASHSCARPRCCSSGTTGCTCSWTPRAASSASAASRTVRSAWPGTCSPSPSPCCPTSRGPPAAWSRRSRSAGRWSPSSSPRRTRPPGCRLSSRAT